MPKALREVPANCSCKYIAPELRYQSQICTVCARHYNVNPILPSHWSRRVKSILKERLAADAKQAEQESEEALTELKLEQAEKRINQLIKKNKKLEQDLREVIFIVGAVARHATEPNSP